MQEPYRKGLANHPGPESCADGREAAGEALTARERGRERGHRLGEGKGDIAYSL
jgi:hypothetical protein